MKKGQKVDMVEDEEADIVAVRDIDLKRVAEREVHS